MTCPDKRCHRATISPAESRGLFDKTFLCVVRRSFTPVSRIGWIESGDIIHVICLVYKRRFSDSDGTVPDGRDLFRGRLQIISKMNGVFHVEIK